MNPDTWRLLGVAAGIVVGSTLGVAVVWTLVYLARRDAERRAAGCPPPAGCVHECTHDVSHELETRPGRWEDPDDEERSERDR